MNTLAGRAKPLVLVAPLDWGLGHATRCIPIISALISRNCNVLMAAEARSAEILRSEFPDLPIVPLKGYRITYSRTGWKLPLVLTAQIPRILSAINEENQWLDDTINNFGIQAVISDNRYGLYHESIPSVFMTHQLLIKTPLGRMADRGFQKLNYEFINHFTSCWIPDEEGKDNLSGELSHPEKKPHIPIHYLGPLSRFKRSLVSEENFILVIISGPEPQRTIFEELIVEEAKTFHQRIILIRGLPGEAQTPSFASNIEVHNHLPASELQSLMQTASIVISRSGYSTVMDLAVLQKKSILIPTPGQSEQEYLASHLMEKRFALCIAQSKFKMKNAIELSKSFPYHLPPVASDRKLGYAVDDLISKIREKNS